MTVVDCQTHWHPKEYFEELAKRSDYPRCRKSAKGEYFVELSPGSEFPIIPELLDLDGQLERAEAAGVDVVVSNTGAFGVEDLPAEEAVEMAELLNECSSRAQAQNEGRLVTSARIPMQVPDAVAGVLDRAIEHHGLRVICLSSNLGGKSIAGPEQVEVYGEIESRGIPIFLHPTRTPMEAEWKRYGLEYVIGFMVDSSVAALDLVFSGVMERYRSLKILHPHLGGVLPFLSARVDFEYRQQWAHGKRLAKPPTEYLKMFYTDTISQTDGAMAMALNFYGAEHLVFSSDGPYWPVEDELEFCRRTVPADVVDAVLGETAAELLGLGR